MCAKELTNNDSLRIKSWAEDDRPREKFMAKGRSALSDAELIAILIGSGNKNESAVELSKKILSSVGNNLNRLGQLSLNDLMKFKGIGEAKAISIISALELGRRRKTLGDDKTVKIESSITAFEALYPYLADLDHEQFYTMLLNRSNKVIDIVKISQGGVSGTVADSKLIFKSAVEKLASGIILAHNHPSGNLSPSQADITLTRKLQEAGKLLDISVLDHIIIANNEYFSFADQGMI
jgi:DNA repair protein RadC